jgi:acid phosphatase (class A)
MNMVQIIRIVRVIRGFSKPSPPMKKILVIILAAMSLCSLRAQDTVVPYFTTAELPDLIRCLPAPPDTIGEHFAHDIMRYMWGKAQRQDSVRADIVRRDAVWTFDALFAEFSVPFGMEISREGTPEIWRLLETSITTTDQMRVAPKAYYHRRRPFERFNEPTLTGEDDALRGEGSYPSGHTMRGWTTALLLAEINPSAADTLYARGWMYGESRVIAGCHWQSDVDITLVAASIGFSHLHTSPAFCEQMKRARKEFQKLMRKKEK